MFLCAIGEAFLLSLLLLVFFGFLKIVDWWPALAVDLLTDLLANLAQEAGVLLHDVIVVDCHVVDTPMV